MGELHGKVDAMLFIIGAGFNVDARCFVRGGQMFVSYPTVADLAQSCFGLDSLPSDSSIELLFQEAIDRRDSAPLELLCNSIMKADYYLTNPENTAEGSLSFYLAFLNSFPDTHFLTFNYDGLLEILLLRLNHWRPEDGWGMPVRVEYHLDPSLIDMPPDTQRLVIHLHGSLYMYAQEYDFSHPDSGGTRWMHELPEPVFLFDPDTVGNRFKPFARVTPGLHYDYVTERIIAPVPSKATALKEAFVQHSYKLAKRLLHETDMVVSIGYRFSEADEASYEPLLKTLARQHGCLYVIAPDAQEIVGRIGGRKAGSGLEKGK